MEWKLNGKERDEEPSFLSVLMENADIFDTVDTRRLRCPAICDGERVGICEGKGDDDWDEVTIYSVCVLPSGGGDESKSTTVTMGLPAFVGLNKFI